MAQAMCSIAGGQTSRVSVTRCWKKIRAPAPCFLQLLKNTHYWNKRSREEESIGNKRIPDLAGMSSVAANEFERPLAAAGTGEHTREGKKKAQVKHD